MSDHLRIADDKDVKAVMAHCKDMRTVHRTERQGYTKDKTMRHVLSFSPKVLFHPEFSKYFNRDMDPKEARKHMYEFARKHPEYLVVDKI